MALVHPVALSHYPVFSFPGDFAMIGFVHSSFSPEPKKKHDTRIFDGVFFPIHRQREERIKTEIVWKAIDLARGKAKSDKQWFSDFFPFWEVDMEQLYFTGIFKTDYTFNRQHVQIAATDLDSARQAIRERLDAIFGLEQFSLLNVYPDKPNPIWMTPETKAGFHQSNVERMEKLKLAKKEEARKRLVQIRQRDVERKEREANDRIQLREAQRKRQLANRIVTHWPDTHWLRQLLPLYRSGLARKSQETA
jgi:hypothetical protein